MNTARLIRKDRIQSLALSLLQHATVQAAVADDGVILRVGFTGLGEGVTVVPYSVAGDRLEDWLRRELGHMLRDLGGAECSEKYFRKGK